MKVRPEQVAAEGEAPYEFGALVARAENLRCAGMVRDAVAVLEPVVTEYQALAGPHSLITLSLRNVLASLWVEDASDQERIERETELVTDCERVLGAEHAETISARDHSLAMGGEYDRALSLAECTAADATRIFGDDAPTTRHVRTNLAATLHAMGRSGEAARELEALIACSGAPLDPESALRAVRLQKLLAVSYRELGRRDDARILVERHIPDAARLLGFDAPSTRELAALLEDLRAYQGPVVMARGEFPRRWVFVADGRTRPAEPFAPPAARISRKAVPTVVVPRTVPVHDDDAATRDASLEGVDDGTDVNADCGSRVERVEEKGRPVFDEGRNEGRGVEVRVIGPVEVVGWRDPGARVTQLAEILAYLVFHRDRPVRGPALRLALRPDVDDEITEKTLHAYVSMLRRAVGRDLLPPATRHGYGLSDTVTSDWERFCALVTPDASPENLEEALGLVRGRPFAEVPEGTFRWVDAELLVSEIDVAVAGVALRLANAFQSAGDAERASFAVRQGLCCSPYDILLWRIRLALAEARGPGALALARKEAKAMLGTGVFRT